MTTLKNTWTLLYPRVRARFPEEPLPKDHPIRRVKHAVLSSHRAGAIAEGLLNVGRVVVDDMEAICKGLAPCEMQVAQPEFIRNRGA